jgi:hypothetical protein
MTHKAYLILMSCHINSCETTSVWGSKLKHAEWKGRDTLEEADTTAQMEDAEDI